MASTDGTSVHVGEARGGMEQYKFIVFDENKVNILNREFVATDDDVAVRLADGWRDHRGGQVWRGEKLVKYWARQPGK